jgi:proline iminopeptidase
VLFDQRGAGKSTPEASIEANTTWDLVADIERLRTHLGIERWQVFGGSWGSTLALAYAETHPERVSELILRGIFLGRPAEVSWVYQAATVGALYPDGWAHFIAPIPEAERSDLSDLVGAYLRLLTTGSPEARLAAARAWNVWETRLSHLVASAEVLAEAANDKGALATALLEIHYFRHGCFLRTPTQLLDDVHRIRHIPCIIVQGRYDLVCPLQSAWDLAEAWPEADLQIIGDAGHSAFEVGNTRAVVAATDRFAAR